MTKNQLKNSIEQITKAIQAMKQIEGVSFVKEMNALADKRTDLKNSLDRIEQKELKKRETLDKLEKEYSELEAKLDAREYKLSDEQIDALREQLYSKYGEIKRVRGE